MGTATQLTDFSDLYTDLQNRVRETTGVTATQNIAKRYINIALHDMHIGNGEKFPWAHREDVLRTQAVYDTGTLTATKGSTTITGSGTSWDTNNDFSVKNMRTTGKILLNGNPEIYSITAVGGDTSATISDAFIDTTVSGASYKYYEDEYALASDFLRPLDLQVFDTAQEIDLIGRREFRRRYPRPDNFGKPGVATIVDRSFVSNTTPVRYVKLWKLPDAVFLIPYAYVTSNFAVTSGGTQQTQLSSDSDEPIVPLIYRHAIVLHALYHWYRDRKNDRRSQETKAEYVDLLLRITGDVEVGASHPQIQPRIGHYVRRARTPYSTRGRRYITGDAFDQLRR